MIDNNRKKQFKTLLKGIYSKFNFKIIAWVILPNHYHLLFKSARGKDLQTICQLMHGGTSHEWNIEDQTPGRKVWTNYRDYCPRDRRDFYTHFNYIHHNPVKHRVARTMGEWDYSSYNWYIQRKGKEWMADCFIQYPIIDFSIKHSIQKTMGNTIAIPIRSVGISKMNPNWIHK